MFSSYTHIPENFKFSVFTVESNSTFHVCHISVFYLSAEGHGG